MATAAPLIAVDPAAAGAIPGEPPYTLDSGDRLRIVVFGQDGLTNSYFVDAGGNVTLPLIGMVPARGQTTQELARVIADRLRRGCHPRAPCLRRGSKPIGRSSSSGRKKERVTFPG
jgi:polysaccharide export outer membrane protein